MRVLHHIPNQFSLNKLYNRLLASNNYDNPYQAVSMLLTGTSYKFHIIGVPKNDIIEKLIEYIQPKKNEDDLRHIKEYIDRQLQPSIKSNDD